MRRRWIRPGDAPVWAGGKWGRRRVRVNECPLVVRAEDVYTGLIKDNAAALRPGARGDATYRVHGRDYSIGWEVRPNAVWRRGRVFLVCPRCHHRCTRAYAPLLDLSLACRRCWGLSHISKSLFCYSDGVWGRGPFARMFGTTQRDWALEQTSARRQARYTRSLERWDERRRDVEVAMNLERPWRR